MKNKLYRYVSILLLILIAISLSGCWDYMEIERRGYVLGLAIDLADDKDKENKLQIIKPESDVARYAYTIQLPVLPISSIRPSGQGGGGGSNESKFWNLKIIGNSLFEVNREYSTRLDYPPFYEHLKVVVISEEAARTGIYDYLDFLFRDPEMRRRTKIFITPDKADQILGINPRIEDYPSMYLRSLPENSRKTSRLLHRTDLGRVSESLHGGNSFVLPKIIYGKTEVRDAGSAVFKKGKMVGWLDEIQTNYLKWVANYVEGGTVTIESPENPKRQVSLEIKKVKTDVKPVIRDKEITFNINTKAKFNIAEVNHEHDKRAFEEDFIREVERIAEKKIEKQMREVIEYTQNEYSADTFFFWRAMQRYAPDTWKIVQDDWDNVFASVKTNINVDVRIGEVGLIK